LITKRERIEKAGKYLRNRLFMRRGAKVPVLVFGEQRSGTNMLLRCFGRCPATAIYNETDDDAFVDYELRDLDVIRRLVEQSPASHVVFKPTADGNRVAEIVDQLPGARAIWIYRDYRDAVNSALVLFRETSVEYLTNVATRSPAARWRSINITDEDVALIQGHLQRGISEQTARALIWAIRNDFFFRSNMHRRHDVLLLNYEELVRDPATVVKHAYDFVGLDFHKKYTRDVFSTSVGRREFPHIDPEIDRLCAGVLQRLDDYRQNQSHRRETALNGA
jgi:hypothetical protein